MNDKSKGDYVLIPRLPVIPTDKPFESERLQFHLLFQWLSTKHKVNRFKCVDQILKIHDFHMENYMFAFSWVGNPTKLFIFPQDGKTKKKYRVYHSTSINNYLQDTQENIYFFVWRGHARRALASTIYGEIKIQHG